MILITVLLGRCGAVGVLLPDKGETLGGIL